MRQEELKLLEIKLMPSDTNETSLDIRILQIITKLNPNLKSDEAYLIAYYKRIKETWSTSAINNLKQQTGLKLTSKLNRCYFAIAAARLELSFLDVELQKESVSNLLPGLTEEEKRLQQELIAAREKIAALEDSLESERKKKESLAELSTLLLTNRLLPPGPPLNGTEECPAMKILGSPTTLTELEANYKELIKKEHPDVSIYPEELAIDRFSYVRSLYRITRDNWELLKPTTRITPSELDKRMNAPVPYDPKTFWIEQKKTPK